MPGRNSARIAAAAALVAMGSATTLGEGTLTAAVAAAQERVSDLIAGRSPGRRVVADMSKGKPRLDNERYARALPRVREPRNFASPPLTGLGGPEEFVPGFVEAPPPEFAGIFPGDGFPGGGVFVQGPGGGFIFFPGGPGGGGGGGGGCCVVPPGPGPEEPPPPPPVVPEPATWAMMVLGFGAAGWAIRRRRPEVPSHA